MGFMCCLQLFQVSFKVIVVVMAIIKIERECVRERAWHPSEQLQKQQREHSRGLEGVLNSQQKYCVKEPLKPPLG
jgi:hypothetical protein